MVRPAVGILRRCASKAFVSRCLTAALFVGASLYYVESYPLHYYLGGAVQSPAAVRSGPFKCRPAVVVVACRAFYNRCKLIGAAQEFSRLPIDTITGVWYTVCCQGAMPSEAGNPGRAVWPA